MSTLRPNGKKWMKRLIIWSLFIVVIYLCYKIWDITLTEKKSTIRIETLHINEPPELKSIIQFFDYIETPQRKCCDLRTFGGIPQTAEKAQWFGGWLNQLLKINNELHYIDGDKSVCFDGNFKLMPPHCVVYSFGINNEWSFDDAMAKFGCTVHAFDPSISEYSYTRGRNVFFYPIGIGGSNRLFEESKKKEYKANKILPLTNIVKMLKHEAYPRYIDYIKLDIEGEEIYVLLDILYKNPEILSKLKQIAMEIHLGKYNEETFHVFQAFYQYFKELERQKFILLHSSMNSVPGNKYLLENHNRVVNGYYELLWGRDIQ